jgi:hypothetical protein
LDRKVRPDDAPNCGAKAGLIGARPAAAHLPRAASYTALPFDPASLEMHA